MNTKVAAVIVGWLGALATFELARHEVAHAAAVKPVEFATLSVLPSFQHGAEAMAINEAGTVIVGHAWDRSGLMHAVKWTMQSDESWAFNDLAWPAGASSTIARTMTSVKIPPPPSAMPPPPPGIRRPRRSSTCDRSSLDHSITSARCPHVVSGSWRV